MTIMTLFTSYVPSQPLSGVHSVKYCSERSIVKSASPLRIKVDSAPATAPKAQHDPHEP